MKGNFLYRRLGYQILQGRKIRGLSQEDLSTKSRVDRTYVGRIEQGKANPSFKTMCKLSRALKMSLSELFKGV